MGFQTPVFFKLISTDVSPTLSNHSHIKPYEQDAPKSYGETRQVVGKELLTSLLKPYFQSGTPMVGDFPCGQGQYSKLFLDLKCDVTLVDGSKGMLQQAQENCKSDTQKTRFFVSNLANMAQCIGDNSLDFISCNQFVHHVVSPKSEDKFGILKAVLNEFFRTLKSGGTVCINFCTPKQTEHAFFTRQFFPKSAIHAETAHFPSVTELTKLLQEVGFTAIDSQIDYQQLQGDIHQLDFNDPKVRHGDSGWTFVSKEDLDDVLDSYNQVRLSEGGLKANLQKVDLFVKNHGVTTFIIAKKP